MRHLTDSELLRQTTKLIQQERELLTQVLEHLREISDRKLFAELGYKSLFEFAVKHLGYSEDQSYRRIAAMKLITHVPGLNEKVQKGEVNLTHINLAQSLFRQEAKLQKALSTEQKIEVFNKIAGTSAREAERITSQMSSKPEALRPEKVRAISEDAVSIQLTLKNGTLQTIETLKGWLAHKLPNLSTGELVEKLCELGMTEWNPSRPARKKAISQTSSSRRPTAQADQNNFQSEKNRIAHFVQVQSSIQSIAASLQDRDPQKDFPYSVSEQKRISTSVRKQVFQAAQNQCKKCHSTFLLEIDHRLPKALGGSNDPENLRLLCRNCNQRSAINAFGIEKILKYNKTEKSFASTAQAILS